MALDSDHGELNCGQSAAHRAVLERPEDGVGVDARKLFEQPWRMDHESCGFHSVETAIEKVPGGRNSIPASIRPFKHPPMLVRSLQQRGVKVFRATGVQRSFSYLFHLRPTPPSMTRHLLLNTDRFLGTGARHALVILSQVGRGKTVRSLPKNNRKPPESDHSQEPILDLRDTIADASNCARFPPRRTGL